MARHAAFRSNGLRICGPNSTPIPRAVVLAKSRIEEKNAYQRIRSVSSDEGFCKFRGLRVGRYSLEVAAYGYEDATLSEVDLEALNTVWLQPSPALSGVVTVHVYDKDGKPWSGVDVTCSFAGDAVVEATNAKGVCVFSELPATVCKFEVVKPKGATNDFVGRFNRPLGEGDVLTIYLGTAPRVMLVTRFVDTEGRPLVKTIRFAGADYLQGKTTKDGIMRLRSVPGDYLVSVIGPTKWDFSERLRVEAAPSSEVEFILGRERLDGQIVGAAKYDVTKVRLVGSDRSGETQVFAEGGTFKFDGVIPGRYVLELPELKHPLAPEMEVEIARSGESSSDGKDLGEAARTVDVESIAIDLERMGVLELFAADADGRPLIDGEVECRTEDDDSFWLAPHHTGRRGSAFGATCESGKCRVFVRSAGRVVWRGRAEVKVGETTRVQVALEAGE